MARKKKAEFTKWFGPLLDALRDLGDSGRPQEVSGRIAKNLNLPDKVLDETLKSGGGKFHNQVAWARQYLVWEGLLDSSKDGTWTLTEKGRNAMIGRAEKGIIITTSSFTNAAVIEANREGVPQVELVDGIKLVKMFQRVELGVKKRTVYDVDPSYFEKFKI